MAMQALEALRQVQQGEMGRRDFLKLAVGGVGGALLLDRMGGLARAADTSVEFVDNPFYIAGNYGWDTISKDARMWKKAVDSNGVWDGGWVFDSTRGDGKTFQGDGKPHGILVQGADGNGAEARGWIKIPTPGGEFVGLQAVHRNALLVDAIQTTIYKHRNPDDGWVKLADEIRNTRKTGEIWLPINEGIAISREGDILLFPINSKADAVRLFAVPGTQAENENNWQVFDGGPQGDRYAKFKSPDGQNVGIKLWSPEKTIWGEAPGSMWPVAQGSIIKPGSPLTLFAAHPDVGEVFGNEITVRLTTNPSPAWRNSVIGLRSLRTGLTVLPIVR